MTKYKFAGLVSAVVGLALAGTAFAVSYNFPTDLKLGMTSADVRNLQVVLNTSADTRVAATGAGSAGLETTYFGALTKAAVMKYQTKVGVPSTGYVGPLTRGKLNAATVVVGTLVPGCTSRVGFSTTTGASCAGTVSTTFPAGCTSAVGFSPTTGQSCGTVVPVTPTGAVSVALAATNPEAGLLVDGQATANLTAVTFTGTGTVTSVTLQRTGLSDQNALTNVYLYDGVTRITDGYSFNQSGVIIMNGLTIAVNGSKTIFVKGDVSATASATNASLGVSLTSYTVGGVATPVSLVGNLHSDVVGNLAGVVVGATTVAAATVNAGISAYTFWSAPVQINTRAVSLKSASFRMVGSAPSDALSNIRMYIDGVDTGVTASLATVQGSNYAVFDLTSAPKTLETGSHTVSVRATIDKGSSRTIQMSLQQAADLTVTDSQMGVNIAATGTPNSGGIISIAAGSATLLLDPAFQSSTNVAGGASNVAIGKFKLHAYGEDVKVSSLAVLPVLGASVAMAPVDTTLDQVTLYYNGSQIGSSQQFAGAVLTYQLGSQMIITAGSDATLEIRANIRSSASVNYTAGSISVTVNAGAANAQGQLSLTSVDFPTATVVGNALSVQTGLLQMAKNVSYADQTASPNTSGVKIGSFVLQNQSTSESVRVTSLVVALGGTTALTNLSALRTSETSGSGSVPVQPQATNTFSVDFTLAAGATKTIDILADTSTATTSASTLAATRSGATLGAGAGVDGVTAVVAVAQVQTATLTGGAGTYGLTVNGTTITVPFNGNLTDTATDLKTAVNAQTTGLTATSGVGTVTITADVAGTPFTMTNVGSVPSGQVTVAAASTANVVGVAEVVATGTVTLTGVPVAGDVVSLTVNDETKTYTVLAADISTVAATTLTNVAAKVVIAAASPMGTGNTVITSTGAVITATAAAGTGAGANAYPLVSTVTPLGATVQTTATVTSIGSISNVSTTSGAIPGQIITLAAGTLTTPTAASVVSSSSTSAQYIASASGAAKASKITYNFASTNGPSTINELTFDVSTGGSTTGAVSSLTIGTTTAPVVGNVAYFTGLSIAVPNGGSGVNQDVFVTYSPIGTSGVASGAVSIIELTTVKYTSGGTTATLGGIVGGGSLAVDSAQMTLVGSKPIVTLTLPNGASGSSASGLAVGTIYVADVKISADAQGDIVINTIPLKFTGNAAGTTVTVADNDDIVIQDATGAVIPGYTIADQSGAANQNATGTITFTAGYTIAKGTTATFKVFAKVAAVSGTGASLATGLSTIGSFTWTDTAGASATPVAFSAATVPAYPSSTVSLVN